MKIEAFVFDLFGVLASFDNNIVYARLARHCADPEDAFRNLDGLMSSREVVTGGLTLRQVHRRLVDMHGLALAYPDFEAAWLRPYSEPMPGMADLVSDLSERYRMVLLSNVDRYYWEVVRAMQPQLQRFDSVLLSCDLGLAKPEPQIFRQASLAAAADPSRCMFVDDTAVNVEAAGALGFRTHWFRGVSELYQELERLHVLPDHRGAHSLGHTSQRPRSVSPPGTSAAPHR